MKILFVGEIVARPGRQTVKEVLPEIIAQEKPDLVLANAENIAHGRGATTGTINEMIDVGVEFFTGGDHLFWHKGFENEIDDLPIIRPANIMDGDYPGKGYEILETDAGKVLIINVMAIENHHFSKETLDNPYLVAERIIEEEGKNVDVILVDFHAEYTSDKHAMGFYLDGRADVVLGTHTHVPTSDPRVLPEGTLYVTDVGMCGNTDSVLGVKKEIILNRVIHGAKERFEWALEGRRAFRSVLIDTTAKEIRRLDKQVT
ncbi:YmdB family metallophosphoesterase [candidate division WWE3 bacterium]|jgi:2',3'-cyclic-nucleotide 2'-phosphodiesterase|nr:YmdB family metallophosphoesterase [candidate division WWE3 bacterium]MBT7349490.1 YmdB family metallophosphoesterase [candidate division WWE3 bacterium]